MRIALDASYSVDAHPSGIAVYSRELLMGLAADHPEDEFLHCYRPKQFRSAPQFALRNVTRRLLLPPLPTFRADLFHALNQRVDSRPAKRVVSTFHDLFVMTGEYSSPEFRARFTQQARLAARNSDRIIAVSRFTANQVSTMLDIDPAQIRVAPHGVHLPEQVSTLDEREPLILFVGALQVRKNLARLVEAFEALPANWRLALAGASTGYGAEAILERIERSPCRGRIQVTGYLSPKDLERFYVKASIFAFPSLDEGFGIPVLEAMAHGIPVVTSNRSALPEVAGDAARLVDPENVDEIAGALCQLVHDPGERSRFAALGLARAQLYSWQAAVNATYAVYRELLAPN